MDEEIRFHIEMETETNLRAGMKPPEARRVALARFGGVERHRQELREGRDAPVLELLFRDLCAGFRTARRSPGFSLVAALTVALGVGATSSVYSVINTLLIRPLTLPRSGDLVAVDEVRRGAMAAGTDGWRDSLFALPHVRRAHR
jgi:hypothetical protein